MAAPVPSPALRAACGGEGGVGQVSLPAVFALLAAILACMSPALLGDGDTWTHVAAGRWMIGHGEVLRWDPFSATMAGQPWDAHEWLSEVLLAIAFAAAGPTGVTLLAAGAAALLFGRLARDVGRTGGWWGTVLLTTAALVAVLPSLLARPHLLALPVLEAWAAALLRARARAGGRGPSPWLLGLMVLWANLHGGFAFGIALAGVFAVEAAVAEARGRRAGAWRWAAFAVGSVAAAALTPQGLDGLLFPWRLLQLHSLRLIAEWQPVDLRHDYAYDALLAGLVALLGWGRVRLCAFRAALLAGLVYLTLTHARHGVLLGVVGALLLAEPVGRAFGGEVRRCVGRGVCYAGLGIAAAVRLTFPVAWADGRASPVSAVAGLPAGTAVLNSYPFGGYLALAGLRPLIDGRAELFGDRFIAEYLGLAGMEPERLGERLAQDGLSLAVLTEDDPLVERLEAVPGWRRRHADGVAVVFERE